MASWGLVLPKVFPLGTLLKSLKQTKTSMESGEENIITAEMSDGTKTEFSIRNGKPGTTGLAAGFDTPTAEVNNETGTPSVEVTATGKDTKKKFHFSFKNLKGEKGDTGAAAGFGTPTASVNNETGTPSVEVTATGEESAKVFNFAFKNLKGDKGDDGASLVSVKQTQTSAESDGENIIEMTLADGTKSSITIHNGAKGDKGDVSDTASRIIDYGDSNGKRTIQVGFTDKGLTAETASHLAGFYNNGNGYKIRNISKEESLKFLELTPLHIVNMIYPVGSVYLSMSATDPKEIFVGTKWEKISKGKCLAGVGVGRDINKLAYSIGMGEGQGEYYHYLTENQMPRHKHSIAVCNDGNPDGRRDRSTGADCQYWNTQDNRTNARFNINPETEAVGQGDRFNNMPPYFGVFVWQRIA